MLMHPDALPDVGTSGSAKTRTGAGKIFGLEAGVTCPTQVQVVDMGLT
jgi:hypothetical protein